MLVVGLRELKEIEAHLSATFESSRTGHIGNGDGCATAVVTMKRTVRLNPDFGKKDLEADPRHVKGSFRCSTWRSTTTRQRLDDKEVDRIVARASDKDPNRQRKKSVLRLKRGTSLWKDTRAGKGASCHGDSCGFKEDSSRTTSHWNASTEDKILPT